MMPVKQLDFNNCLKEVNHIGYTTYVNVCNHTFSNVSWGAYDWFLTITASLMILAGLFVVFYVVFKTIKG